MSAFSLSAVKTDAAPRESLRIIAGGESPTGGALAIAEDSAGMPVLVKYRAATDPRPATATAPARPGKPAAWRRTAMLADFARAIADGLIDADV